VDHYLSLFFIPLFPVKKGTPILSCENCQAAFDEAGGPMDIGGFPEPKPSQCPSCKRPVKPNYSFCPFCGKPM
jgi:rubrerythrin